MSKKLASLLIKINADGANAKRVMTELEGRVDKFAKNMQKIGTMKVVNVSEAVMEVFDITGFTDILTIE